MCIVGGTQVGKSSLVINVEEQLKRDSSSIYKVLKPCLYCIRNEEEFYLALCDEMGIEGMDSSPMKKITVRRALQRNKFLIILDNVDIWGYSPWKDEGEFLSVLSVLGGLSDSGDISLLMTTSTSLDALFPQSICALLMPERITLHNWSMEEAKELIQYRLSLSKTNLSMSDEELNDILYKSGGHPGKLMRECFKWWQEKHYS